MTAIAMPPTPVLDRMQAPHLGAWTRKTKGPVDPVSGEPAEGYEPCRLVDHSQLIGQFLDWLQTQGICLAVYADRAEVETEYGFEEALNVLVPDHRSIQKLLAEYFEVDEDAAEAERMAILEALRSGQ